MENKFKNEQSAKEYFKSYKKDHPKTKKTWADFFDKPKATDSKPKGSLEKAENAATLTPEQKSVVSKNVKKLQAEIAEPKATFLEENKPALIKAAKVSKSIPILLKGVAAFTPYGSDTDRDLEDAAKELEAYSKTGAEFGRETYKFLFKGGKEDALRSQTDKVLMPVAEKINDSIGSTVAHALQSLPEFAAKRIIAKAPGITSNSVKERDIAIKNYLEKVGIGIVKKRIPAVAFMAYKGTKFSVGLAGLTLRTGATVMQIPMELAHKVTKTKTIDELAEKDLKTVFQENVDGLKDFYAPGNRSKVAKAMMDTNRQTVADTLRLMKSLVTNEDPIASIDRLSENAGKITPALGVMSKDLLDSIYRQGMLKEADTLTKQLVVTHITQVAVKGFKAEVDKNIPKDVFKEAPTKAHYDKVMADFVKKEIANTPSGLENMIRQKGGKIFFDKLFKKTFKELDGLRDLATDDKKQLKKINDELVSPKMLKAFNAAGTFRTYVNKFTNMTVGKLADVIDTEPTNKKAAKKNMISPESFVGDCYDSLSNGDEGIWDITNSFASLQDFMNASDEELMQATIAAKKKELLSKLEEAKTQDDMMSGFMSEVYNIDEMDIEVIISTLHRDGGLSEKGMIQSLHELTTNDQG